MQGEKRSIRAKMIQTTSGQSSLLIVIVTLINFEYSSLVQRSREANPTRTFCHPNLE